MQIVYMGTPDFAVPCLEALLQAGHDVRAVFTQPDKPRGRGYALMPPPVKVCAQAHGIDVCQPPTLKDGQALQVLKALCPEVIVVAAYGKILPKEILSLPRYGCINVHASLLPKYRGAAPIQWAVLNGETESGITIMQMEEGLDTGDILLQEAMPIGPDETAAQLHDRLSVLGAQLLVKALAALQAGDLHGSRQDDALSSYAPMLDKSICTIDWNQKNTQVHNQVRGLNAWPVAVSSIGGKKLKIYNTRLCEKSGKAGTVLSIAPLTVACGEKSVVIEQVQLEGKKRMTADDFLRGHPLRPGDSFL
ncbi:MAG: methionyl-tRNA formyltransferase [Acutalibacteraceae bacterium]|nr:methionyl-tRNA formyltransferase [Acutalibacteraceae bacterium]